MFIWGEQLHYQLPIRRVMPLLLLVLLWPAICFANALCRAVLRKLPQQREDLQFFYQVPETHSKIEAVVSILVTGLGRDFENPQSVTYDKMIGSTRGEKRSLHISQHNPVQLRKNTLAKVNEDDTRVVITYPDTIMNTVWDRLTPAERTGLVVRLAEIFQQGEYDHEVRSDSTSPTNPLRDALVSRTKQELRKNFRYSANAVRPDYDVEGVQSGMVPRRVLKAASMGCKVGVCRQAAANLAGLLVELGIPPDDIKLVLGAKNPGDKIGHIWVEYRVSEGGDWLEADATAYSREADPFPRAAVREPAPRTSNRILFPAEREEYLHFSTPVNLTEPEPVR